MTGDRSCCPHPDWQHDEHGCTVDVSAGHRAYERCHLAGEQAGPPAPVQQLALPDVEHVLEDVAIERTRQDAKWGEQNHRDVRSPRYVSLVHGIPTAADAKRMTDTCAAAGRVSWTDILVEEVAEAAEAAAEGDLTALRTELVQVAAVAVQWIQAIDRRTAGRP